jgi:hypothetical protein
MSEQIGRQAGIIDHDHFDSSKLTVSDACEASSFSFFAQLFPRVVIIRRRGGASRARVDRHFERSTTIITLQATTGLAAYLIHHSLVVHLALAFIQIYTTMFPFRSIALILACIGLVSAGECEGMKHRTTRPQPPREPVVM